MRYRLAKVFRLVSILAFAAGLGAAGCGEPSEDGAGADTASTDVGTDTQARDVTDDTGAADVSDAGGRKRIVFKGKDFGEGTYRIAASESLVAFQVEDSDSKSGSSAEGTISEPFERDIYYATGTIETLEAGGNIQATVDGEIRRNGPRTKSKEPSGAKPPIEMTIHSSKKLLQRNGRVTEKMVARFAARAFDDAGYGYEIVYNFFPEEPPDEKSNCSAGEAPNWWKIQVENENVEHLRKDVNLLMTDANGGGCGSIGGRYGTAPGRNIGEMRPWEEVGSDDQMRNLHGTLHEIGHQLGARHDHDDMKEGAQHPGSAWNETDESGKTWWHRTPTTAGNGAPNVCGTHIEKRQTQPNVRRHQLYSECFASQMDVKDVE